MTQKNAIERVLEGEEVTKTAALEVFECLIDQTQAPGRVHRVLNAALHVLAQDVCFAQETEKPDHIGVGNPA